MNKFLTTILVLAGCFVVKAESVDVYILSGQSNMQGIGKLKNLPDTYKQPRKSCYFWNGKTFELLVPGKTKSSAKLTDFGPEIGFSYIMEQMRPTRKTYIVKYFASGQPLHYGWNRNKWVNDEKAEKRWNFYPGDKQNDSKIGLHYKSLKDKFTKALKHLKDENIDYEIKGFVWMQGEQDTKNPLSAGEYAKCLKQLKTILEKDVKAAEPLPMVFGQVCPHEPALPRFTNRSELRQSQTDAHYKSGHSDSIPEAFMIPTEGMPLQKDTVHYNAEGQILLGQEMALKMIRMQNILKHKQK